MEIKWEKGSSLPKYLLIGLAIIVLIALLINFLVNLAANFFLSNIVVNSQNNLTLNLNARVFPYPKLVVRDLLYKYEGKPVLSVGQANLGFSLLELFQGNLHIYSINFNQVLINLPNLPKPTIYESTNDSTGDALVDEKKTNTKTTTENTFLGLDSINLEDTNIIYSSSPNYAPLYFKTVKIDDLSSGKAQFHMQLQDVNAVINGNLSPLSNRPIAANLSIPEGLLNQLAASITTPSVCPLNPLATDIIKGLKLNITLAIYPTTSLKDKNFKKTLIQIAGTGISIEEGVLPANLQQSLQSCFGYQLQDKR